MGNDSPLAVLSNKNKTLYHYFKQLFAQVTNPPIDPIREELVTSLVSFIGPKPNLLGIDEMNPPLRLEVSQPVLDFDQMETIRHIERYTDGKFRSFELDITYPLAWGKEAIEARLASLAAQAEDAVRAGYSILIISDRRLHRDQFAIPALLALSAIHQHLVNKGLRTSTGLVVETGSAREVHHFALLGGYGAEAVHPYLALETLMRPRRQQAARRGRRRQESLQELRQGDRQGPEEGDVQDGHLDLHVVHRRADFRSGRAFARRSSTSISPARRRTSAASACSKSPKRRSACTARRSAATRCSPARSTPAANTPGACAAKSTCGRPTRSPSCSTRRARRAIATYKEYAQIINDQSRRHMTFRGLFEFRLDRCTPVPIEEVEPAAEIVKRFSTGAMSLGSISTEAHTTLADRDEPHRRQVEHRRRRRGPQPLRAGQGGRNARIAPGRAAASSATSSSKPGDSLKSKIKQVASGRFGVTAEYLASAEQIQIKMAQGAKPGEGGQLPGRKVSEYIALLRYSTPGVELISPPPHHDIYSIEDLAQLIHDLKNANSAASISVKLVSEVGVGTVAAGVAKAKADHVTISGHDGGTGASPWSSIKHAGTPWELGLAETQQTLVLNRLRGRIAVQADGQMKTGRDVVVGALLGADEFGFATAPLVVDRLHHDAQVPPEHLPGRRRDAGPGAAQEVHAASPSTSSTTSSTSPRKRAS